MELMKKVETTLFTEAVGNSPTARVLQLLIIGQGFDYSLSDIVREASISWSTIHDVIPKLEKIGIIRHVRNIGMAKMYKIDNENPIANAFMELFLKIQNNHIDKMVANQSIEI